MFIYSLKAKTLKYFGIACLALVAVIVLASTLPSLGAKAVSSGGEINYSKVKSNEDRIEFLKQFGWEVTPEAVESEQVTIPSNFDKVFASYNEIQRRQGLDLSKYKGKTMMRYTYDVTNYKGYEGRVQVNMLIYRGKVVGGDICSADVNGFIHGFEAPSGN
jgi:hypothetical protein